jgi:hypothetical protein
VSFFFFGGTKLSLLVLVRSRGELLQRNDVLLADLFEDGLELDHDELDVPHLDVVGSSSSRDGSDLEYSVTIRIGLTDLLRHFASLLDGIPLYHVDI